MTLAMSAGASAFELHGKTTRRAEFLARMEALVPSDEFCALIETHYPRAGHGRTPVGLRMLRMWPDRQLVQLGR